MEKKPKKHKEIKDFIEKAFQSYVAMGANRSLENLAKELKLNSNRVKSWSNRYGWAERLAEIAKRVSDKIRVESEKNIVESIVHIKKRQADISKIVISTLMKRLNEIIKNGEIIDFSVSDLEKMMKHELLISGAISDQIGVNPVTLFNIQFSPPAQRLDNLMQQLTPTARMEIIKILKQQNKNSQVNINNKE